MEKHFDFNRFKKVLNKEKELTDAQIEAHRIISTISDYDDCTTEFLMSLTEEGLQEAMKMVEVNVPQLASMMSADKLNNMLRGTNITKKPNNRDLF